jgi:hypothetical protein
MAREARALVLRPESPCRSLKARGDRGRQRGRESLSTTAIASHLARPWSQVEGEGNGRDLPKVVHRQGTQTGVRPYRIQRYQLAARGAYV